MHWVQFSWVGQSCLTLCDPVNRSMPGLPVHHQLQESTQTHVHWVSDAIQPSHPLLSPSPAPIFPSIRVLSNESALHFKWPKYWSFSFNISPSNEYSGLSDHTIVIIWVMKILFVQFFCVFLPWELHEQYEILGHVLSFLSYFLIQFSLKNVY